MPLPCPDCAAALPDPVGPACDRCGLPLRGPEAARLYEIDTRLAALSAERAQVLGVLRRARAGVLVGAGSVPALDQAPAGWQPPPVPGRPARSPQTVLLGLGALLLLVATSVFLAVVWLVIGVAGQVLVLGGATAAAGAASVATARRGLGSTSTTLAWLAAGLTVVAVQGGRALGLAGLADLSVEGAVALTAAVGTGLAAATARRTGLAVFAVQAVVSSAVVLPAALLDAGAEPWLLLAATGGWAAGALLLARQPVLEPAASTATLLGGVVLVGTVAAGLLVTGTDLPGRGLRAGVVVAALTSGVLAGALRRAPSVLPAAAPAAGAAGVLLAYRVADVLGDDPALAVTLAASAAWAVAAGLLAVRRTTPTWCAVAAASGAGLALAHAVLRSDWPATSVLAAGLAVAAGVAAALHRHDWRVRAGAVPVAAAAAGGSLVAALVAAGAGTLPVVVLAAGVGVVSAGTAGWCSPEPEEPGLGAVAVLALLGALAGAVDGTPALDDPALVAAAVLAVGGVLGLGYGCLPHRGTVAVLGVASSSAASWTLLASRDVDLLEVYTLPVAALLLLVGLGRVRLVPGAPSWTTVGPAVAMALVPSAQLGAAEPGSGRALLVTAAAVAVVLAGVRLRLRALVLVGGVVAGELALAQLGQAALYVPRWLVLAVLGALLLGAGATYEARVEQARAAGRWVRALR